MVVTNIIWDTDEQITPEDLGLPVEIAMDDCRDYDVAECLTDVYGYCVKGFVTN